MQEYLPRIKRFNFIVEIKPESEGDPRKPPLSPQDKLQQIS
jgi:hypothetical protein